MDSKIIEAINNCDFFNDFILFLKTLKQKGGLDLTKTGNLQRKEINYFGQIFKIDIYHRDDAGKIMWPINTEDEVQHLIRIRLISKVMNLTYQRKGKLLLSKNGKAYLTNIDKQTQFEQMILWYFHRCNWAYMHHYLEDSATIFQENQLILWRQLISQKDNLIDFKKYVEGIRLYFRFSKNEKQYSDRTEWAVERIIIKDLELYNLIDVNRIPGQYGKVINNFKLTKSGEHILNKFLNEPF
ncbi:hypothetical protein COS77_02830 [Candidatus Roizmanbacteria bacterium CG06_land_8_20_14_3_00_34_14]|uniref:Uncharacterized protein n=1 Tax=Candidatus Roizmanbacteria bacterium CG06_land_8_20_14_3_00_34_14 TaxID=1974848 RepID=A0A2M7AUD3_9BACT|nr:MAG: hypothetical protein COS77_02830 [Candidatus Roizmanbacteria bacterium CG06_land_8_20_14_3_00_34_14]